MFFDKIRCPGGVVIDKNFGQNVKIRHTVRGQGRKAVGLVCQRSIGGLKRTHTLVDKSSLMPVLWSVMRATWESTSYGCKCVILNIKE